MPSGPSRHPAIAAPPRGAVPPHRAAAPGAALRNTRAALLGRSGGRCDADPAARRALRLLGSVIRAPAGADPAVLARRALDDGFGRLLVLHDDAAPSAGFGRGLPAALEALARAPGVPAADLGAEQRGPLLGAGPRRRRLRGGAGRAARAGRPAAPPGCRGARLARVGTLLRRAGRADRGRARPRGALAANARVRCLHRARRGWLQCEPRRRCE